MDLSRHSGGLCFHRWVTSQFVGYEGLGLGLTDADEGKELLIEMCKSEEQVSWGDVNRMLDGLAFGLKFVPPNPFSIAIHNNKKDDGGGEVWHLPIRKLGDDGAVEIAQEYCVVTLD